MVSALTSPRDELLPGNGALCTMIEVATGVKPTYIGKPSSIIVSSALKMLNAQSQDAILVGDNYDTDIMAGINCGIDSLLTMAGAKYLCASCIPLSNTHITGADVAGDSICRFSVKSS